MRFAGNNLFGDFYGMSSSLNGFYKQYKDLFKKKINESSQKSELGHILDDILANNNSADLVSFLFSLENNAALKKKGEKIMTKRFGFTLAERRAKRFLFLQSCKRTIR